LDFDRLLTEMQNNGLGEKDENWKEISEGWEESGPDYSLGKYCLILDLSEAAKNFVFSSTRLKYQITNNKNKLKLLVNENMFGNTSNLLFNEIVLYKK